MVVATNTEINLLILKWLHDPPLGVIQGGALLLPRLGPYFSRNVYSKIFHYVRVCDVSLDLLQPLPISDRVWTGISMDFIEGLPPSVGKPIIFVVVD